MRQLVAGVAALAAALFFYRRWRAADLVVSNVDALAAAFRGMYNPADPPAPEPTLVDELIADLAKWLYRAGARVRRP